MTDRIFLAVLLLALAACTGGGGGPLVDRQTAAYRDAYSRTFTRGYCDVSLHQSPAPGQPPLWQSDPARAQACIDRNNTPGRLPFFP